MSETESGYVHRNTRSLDVLVDTLGNGRKTLYDHIVFNFNRYSKNDFAGTRKILPDGSVGEYVFVSYKDALEQCENFASGLRTLGLTATQTLGIYTVNCLEAVVADVANHLQSFVTVSLYDTLGEEYVEYILNHAEIPIALCNQATIENVLKVASKCRYLHTIIQIQDLTPSQVTKYSQYLNGTNVNVVSYQDVIQRGKSHRFEHTPPQPSDKCTILYTSGTTGNPKGVVLTHANFLAAVSGARSILGLNESDTHISYLPLAHVYERLVILSGLEGGGRIGFYQGDITKLVEDIHELRPTVLVGVPRVFQRLFERVQAQVNSSFWHRRQLFHYAYNTKLQALHNNEKTPYLDWLVFSKIREKLGGNIRLIISGSAPLSPELHIFLKAVFNCAVIQGYGLSETGAAGTLGDLDSLTYGHVGKPVLCNEIKLVSVPEMNYTVRDTPMPRGEVWMRGPNIFEGYYKEPELTREAFSDDGWFKTGDIGQWTPTGDLQLIDRKKNIFKLSQGEYVAAEKLENVYLNSPFVGQIWVYGDSFQNHLVAVVVPVLEPLQAAAKSNNVNGTLKSLCDHEVIQKIVLSDLARVAKEHKLKGFEQIKAVHLEPEEFNPTNQLTTPTMKLKRSALKDKYQSTIQSLYANISVPPAKL